MSDQRRSGAVISLEEIFRSREFGRRPARWAAAPVATVEATEPPHLEEVFLSEFFGHPEAIAVPAATGAMPAVPPAAGPGLVLLSGGRDAARDFTRYRGAIGAVSGVAAAALVVAGMTSGPGSRSEQPTVSAEGQPPGHGSAPGGEGPLPASGGVATPPNGSGPGTGRPATATGGSPFAQLASASAPAPAAVLVPAPPPPTPVAVVPSPPAPPGGTSPSGPSPGGSVLTPVLAAAGHTVSAVGSTVTAASNDLAQAVPPASPVTGLLSTVGATVTSLGSSVAGA